MPQNSQKVDNQKTKPAKKLKSPNSDNSHERQGTTKDNIPMTVDASASSKMAAQTTADTYKY